MALTNLAIDKRVISNYFGNIAFAYEDYGFPYCFLGKFVLIQGSTSRQDMAKRRWRRSTKKKTDEKFDGKIGRTASEYYFRTAGVVFRSDRGRKWLRFSEDPIPNLRKMFSEYSSGYFKVPSVGAGTANTEFEVLTGMSMRFFDRGEYPYKTYAKTRTLESAASALKGLGYWWPKLFIITGGISTAAPRYLTTWDLIITQVRSL